MIKLGRCAQWNLGLESKRQWNIRTQHEFPSYMRVYIMTLHIIRHAHLSIEDFWPLKPERYKTAATISENNPCKMRDIRHLPATREEPEVEKPEKWQISASDYLFNKIMHIFNNALSRIIMRFVEFRFLFKFGLLTRYNHWSAICDCSLSYLCYCFIMECFCFQHLWYLLIW